LLSPTILLIVWPLSQGLNDESLEIVKYANLLGVVVSDNLKWDENTTYLVKRANSRMELLRKVASFGTSIEEKKNIYIIYIRSILEQSCVVWHSSLTAENAQELERNCSQVWKP
jgi:hypothetical protein